MELFTGFMLGTGAGVICTTLFLTFILHSDPTAFGISPNLNLLAREFGDYCRQIGADWWSLRIGSGGVVSASLHVLATDDTENEPAAELLTAQGILRRSELVGFWHPGRTCRTLAASYWLDQQISHPS